MKTTERVRQLTCEGKTPTEIAAILSISLASVSYHRKKLGISHVAGETREYTKRIKHTWEDIQTEIDGGAGHRRLFEVFGVAKQTITEAYKRGDLVRPKYPNEMSLLEYLEHWKDKEATSSFRQSVRAKMVREGHCDKACAICDLREWRGQPAPLELDHIDGDPTNNRLENLRILCLHCHTQTPTFGWRNVHRRKSGRPAGI